MTARPGTVQRERKSGIADGTWFFNEARAVNRIDHPSLVQVSDYGQLPDGMAYIVMEYLKGETLGQRMKRTSGRLPTTDVIRFGRQICTGLAAAHEKEIVHREQFILSTSAARSFHKVRLSSGEHWTVGITIAPSYGISEKDPVDSASFVGTA